MDEWIYHLVMMLLCGVRALMSINIVHDFDERYCVHDYGPFRYYEFHIEIRDDADTEDFVIEFCSALEEQNKINDISVDFVGAKEYPGPSNNWHTVYLTVATL